MDNLKLKLRLRVGSLKEKARPVSMILKERVKQSKSGSDSQIRYSGSESKLYRKNNLEKRNTWRGDYGRERTSRYVY